MTDDSSKPKKLSLSGSKLTLGNIDASKLRAGPSVGGARKTVQVEVRRKRAPAAPQRGGAPAPEPVVTEPVQTAATPAAPAPSAPAADDRLTAQERAARVRALQEGLAKADAPTGGAKATADEHVDAPSEAPVETPVEAAVPEAAPEPEVPLDPIAARRAAELAELQEIEAGEARRREAGGRRQSGKMTITQALSGDDSRRQRSLASVKRQRERARMREEQPQVKQLRDVIIPDSITVGELANRMAERTADVVKELMKLNIMATATQAIDGETAELVAGEFGHRIQRVSESDIEIGLGGDDDLAESLQPRPPVVTIMGHVDHGKTSLLDAIRRTDVAAGESGGITQHIGAYQIKTVADNVITFIDTPGHEAFTEMRSRGANITDIVVLVVAADDSVMMQTIEAINHAKAAGCPTIVAVNKCDKPAADPGRVRSDLLQHEIITEDFGGDVLCVDVSAHTGMGLDKLEEAIMLQAELLELKANPDRPAEGVVVESKVERGKGSVATLLVQRGTLKQGDIFVIGAESGRVRALLDDRGKTLQSAGPGQPVEILGLNGTPMAGDSCVVVESEARA